MEPLSGKASRTWLSPWHDSVVHEQPVIPTGFLMQTHHRWNCDLGFCHMHSHTSVRVFWLELYEILQGDVQQMIEDNSVWKVDEDQQELSRRRETEEKYGFFCCFFVGMNWRLWKHILRTIFIFVGEIWAVSNEILITEMGTHYHFCILSPFSSPSGFVSTKSAKAVSG